MSELIEDKCARAIKFKDYAINHGFDVPDSTIRSINNAFYTLQQQRRQDPTEAISSGELASQQQENEAEHEQHESQLSTQIDKSIKELIALTGPLKLDENGNVSRSVPPIAFVTSDYSLLLYSVAAIAMAIWSIFKYQTTNQNEWLFILAVCMGILGSLVYILFNLTGHLSDQNIMTSNPVQRIVRVFLGGLLGFVFYFSLAQPAFEEALDNAPGNDPAGLNPMLFLPFLAGFSTRLVFGVLYQAVNATLSIFGLEDIETRNDRDKELNQDDM